MEAYREINIAIFEPFEKEAEIICNVNLFKLHNDCLNDDLEIAKKNMDEKYYPEMFKVRKVAERLYAESFSKNPNAVLQDIQQVLAVLEKQDFLNSKAREIHANLMLEAKKSGDMRSYRIHEIMVRESPYNCISFITLAIGNQMKVIETYGNYKILFQPIKEKILEWYSFPESEIDEDLQEYARRFFDIKQEIVSVSAVVPEDIPYPLDKVSQNLFKHLEAGTYQMNVEKAGSNDDLTTIITLDFDELEHNKALNFKKLTPFEKRLYIAAGAMREAGNEYVSPTQIYRLMGNKGNPAAHQIEKIAKSCEGMARIRLSINNQEEAEKYNYPEFQEGLFYLFPVEIVKNITINGRVTDCCIHFLKDELPLFELAKQRKQITRYTPEQWALPFSMTDDNILLDDYFRTRIARMKRDKAKKKGDYNGKMLYKTIYENCEIDNKLKRSRATKKFRTLLDHYIKTGIITSYQEGKDGITITV